MEYFGSSLAMASDDLFCHCGHRMGGRPPGSQSGAEPIRLRLAECGTLAVLFGVLIWTVIQLLAMGMPPEGAARFLGATPRMMTTAVIIGACIGWFVPYLYRSRSRSDGFAAPVLQEST